MAKSTSSDEEFLMKRRARRRLIGAIVLVTGLVAALPMLLDGEQKPVAEDIAINIPSQANNDFSSKIVPLEPPVSPAPAAARAPAAQPAPVAAAAQESVAPPEAPKPAPVADAPVKPAPKPVPAPEAPTKAAPKTAPVADALVKAAAKSDEKPKIPKATAATPPPAAAAKPVQKPAATAQPEPAGGAFVVRLGAFSKPENAIQMKNKLASMSIRGYAETLKTTAGDKTRVRAGPFQTRKEAEMVRDRLKAIGVSGDVVQKP